MRLTPCDLYRMGNATSARLDHVRSVDVDHYDVGGVVWVRAGTGGVSTFDRPGGQRGRWWRLPAGYAYDNHVLLVWNDHGRHWSWEPSVDMLLSDYKSVLQLANARVR